MFGISVDITPLLVSILLITVLTMVSINWVKMILEPTGISLHLGFLWDTLRKTITLPEDKTTRLEAWAKKLLAVNKTTQENLECFVGTLISTTPAVWNGPLPKNAHYFPQRRQK